MADHDKAHSPLHGRPGMRRRRLRGVAVGLLVAALGATVAQVGHVQSDAERHETTAATELLVMPSGEALKIGSLGYGVHLADLLWVRTVLTFGEHFAEDPDSDWQEWLLRMVLAVTTLDPHWRTPYFYGGVMVRVTGDHERSNQIFMKGHEALPDDHFFPFAIGMNYYIGLGDAVKASEWLKLAAGLPSAPVWYAAAARGFIVEDSQRPVAIRYLREELAQTDNPELRKPLEAKLKMLMHGEMVDKFEELQAQFNDAHGGPPGSPGDLVGTGGLKMLPTDPLGGEWVIDLDGSIRSSVDVMDRTQRAIKRERQMLTTHRAGR